MPEVRDAPMRGARMRELVATERFRWWLVFVVLEMIAAVRAASPHERDPYWSARAGVENLEGAPLIRPDTWSWSAEGDWVPNSPGWNLVLGLGWQGSGFWGLFWVAFLAVTAFFALALLLARLAGARALPTLVGFTPVLLLGFAGLTPRATVPVHCLIFVAVLFGWWFGGRVGRLRPFHATTVIAVTGFTLSLVGNWLHLSFMLMAAAIAVMWAIAWWASPGLGAARRHIFMLGGTLGLLLGCVWSPYGISFTIERSRLVAAACRDIVAEWMSAFSAAGGQDFRMLVVATLALAVAVIPAIWVVQALRRQGGRYDPRFRILLPLVIFGVPAVIAGFDTLRFILTGLLAVLPVVAAATSALVDRIHRRAALRRGFWSHAKVVEYTSGHFWTVIIVGLVVLASPFAVVAVARGATPPEAAVVERIPDDCRVWSDAAVAGPIILMRPDAKVWIDGRADFYGREHLLEYLRIISAKDPLPGAADCVILPSSHGGLGDELDQDPAWSRLAARDGYVLWVRD